MKKNNLTYYIQKINQVVEDTEKTGETMHPFFEIVRSAIDENNVDELQPEEIIDIRKSFEDGVAKYQELLEVIKSLKAPARVIGIHKKLERSYTLYVEGCQEMTDALSEDGTSVKIEDFNNAEEKQDEMTEKIAFCIQRMTSILLK
ncbi:hypothetical protein ACWN8V_01795 [Vagococcus elongatus]|uniref:Uncharacterized protein n=1 Tax=Vagococcus elongatus TaxID=180344 RepID=A0A430B4E1_9ENTE|nr:hypothetical protein [Vagococcus elongatus]RSU15220.1 hypothetical protein CBF29_02485 [Vagococcus elongatus]